MKRAVLAFIAAGLLIIIGAIISNTTQSNNIKNKTHFNYDKIHGAMLPKTASFAGEEVPLDKFYVREALDKELQVNTYWHSSTLMLLKRANRWFPKIEPILNENNLPEDFKYLALIESGLENVVSPAGAAGFWQIMKGTARDYGLEVNNDVDERYHLKKSTKTASDFLNKAYEKFGSWTMAAASYNAGMRRINQEIERQQVNTYYDLHLNTETSRYIYRILAVKAIYENPEKFG
ncbi:MAG: lytic transglycosylase domain-containing protein, partial [Bacteroidota bacterium]